MRNMRSMQTVSLGSGPYNERNWYHNRNPPSRIFGKTALEIQRRNPIAQRGKTPLPEEHRSRSRPGGRSTTRAQQRVSSRGIATVREKRKRIPELVTGGEDTAPLGRCDRGISNTSQSMVAWGD